MVSHPGPDACTDGFDADEARTTGSRWQDNGLVFAQLIGKPIDSRRDWTEWKEILRDAKVHDGGLHDARRTAATLLLGQGVDARVGLEILGHSQISLTQNTHQHVMPRVIADATQRLGEVLFAPMATTMAPPDGPTP